MSTPTAINHVAFRCRNLAAQEAFYTKHFGFKRSRTFHRGDPKEFFMLKLGSVRLELFPPDPEKEQMAGDGNAARGFLHLALDVPKLEPALEALKADGLTHDPIIELPDLAPGFRIVFLRDPEGNLLELMEGYVDEA
jgi:glyoxylase I family protein